MAAGIAGSAAQVENPPAAGRPRARQSRPPAATQPRPPAALGAPPRSAEEAAAFRQQVRLLPAGGDPEEALDPAVFSFEPVRLTSGHEPGPQVTLFYVDDEPFTIEAAARMDIGLEALEVMAAEGGASAERYLLVAFLGEDGFAAFRKNVRDPADYRKIAAILARLSIGAVEAPKAGNG